MTSRRRFLADSARAAAGGLALSIAAPALPGAASAVLAPVRPTAATSTAGLPPRRLPPTELLRWVEVVYAQVKAERCSPPSAARIYAHTMVAAYEVVAAGQPGLDSLSGRVNGLAPISRTVPAVSWELAVNEAIAVTAAEVFSDRSDAAGAVLAAYAADRRVELSVGLPGPVATRSVEAGATIGRAVADRAAADGYLGVIGRNYNPPVGPDKWVRTPPNFGAALEPYWAEVQSFALVDNRECKPIPPVAYSEERGSAFWEQANAVYLASQRLTDEQRSLALFWRDNPDGSTGLPSGHWLAIAATVIAQQGLSLDRAAEVLALTSVSLADGFTSCWTEKYETNLLRPVTYVQRLIDPTWNTFVNSPAFPEYTSGHSVGSAAAAATLTHLLGDGVGFIDTTGRQNGYADRTYPSFRAAAEEAALSRLWGGIHYPMGIEQGLSQGRRVSELVIERLSTAK